MGQSLRASIVLNGECLVHLVGREVVLDGLRLLSHGGTVLNPVFGFLGLFMRRFIVT